MVHAMPTCASWVSLQSHFFVGFVPSGGVTNASLVAGATSTDFSEVLDDTDEVVDLLKNDMVVAVVVMVVDTSKSDQEIKH